MSKHTPGPWEAIIDGPKNRGKACLVRTTASSRRSLCIEASRSGDNEEEDFANTRLIAAAPDLLEACKSIVDGWENWSDIGRAEKGIELVKAAIAKAEGKNG